MSGRYLRQRRRRKRIPEENFLPKKKAKKHKNKLNKRLQESENVFCEDIETYHYAPGEDRCDVWNGGAPLLPHCSSSSSVLFQPSNLRLWLNQ
ncbi:hypothetical protein TNCT_444191 [Trichonephila clavata]|uniref:Uncharacterized protein n=1 Tax=Trichonephila clavata TaxID=2740835 RepID=A0A8X6FTR6_TRICU|nr:hypothetical protein TNCT_444191 [Trichonephila clavata]